LIVDHSAINRRVLMEQLLSWGMRADSSGSSSEAFQVLREAVKEGDPYQIALIDDQMPGIQGESLGRSIKGELEIKDTVLLLLTSLGQRGDAQRVLDLGFSAYLNRPIRQSELMDALATVWLAHLHGETVGLVTRHTIAESRETSALLGGARTLDLGARILVAEDNQVNQQVALEILRGFNCKVTMASDGDEALQRATENDYDVIFMDCQMPIMNGYEATAEIRKAHGPDKHVPIIAMTAHAMKGDRERCLAAGMDDYVSKPIDPESVLQVLYRWLPEDMVSRGSEEPPPAPPAPVEPRPAVPLPVLDLHQAMCLTGGKANIFKRVAVVFLQHMPQRIQELEDAIEHGDIAETTRLAHSIQGAAASLSGRRVQETAQRLEIQSRDGSLDNAPELFKILQKEFDDLRQALETVDVEKEWTEMAGAGTDSADSSLN
jgi:two-component system, sensor histidine kinase and response regulator